MTKFHVTFFYLATGMEGVADERDFGIVHAYDQESAKLHVAVREFPGMNEDDLRFMLGCLTAKPIGPVLSVGT